MKGHAVSCVSRTYILISSNCNGCKSNCCMNDKELCAIQTNQVQSTYLGVYGTYEVYIHTYVCMVCPEQNSIIHTIVHSTDVCNSFKQQYIVLYHTKSIQMYTAKHMYTTVSACVQWGSSVLRLANTIRTVLCHIYTYTLCRTAFTVLDQTGFNSAIYSGCQYLLKPHHLHSAADDSNHKK